MCPLLLMSMSNPGLIQVGLVDGVEAAAWDGEAGYYRGAATAAPPVNPGSSPQGGQDELLNLLDVIHRKTVRLRRDLDSRVSRHGAHTCKIVSY